MRTPVDSSGRIHSADVCCCGWPVAFLRAIDKYIDGIGGVTCRPTVGVEFYVRRKESMDEELSDQIRPAISVAASHLFLLVVLMVFCLFRVPHYADVYKDLGADLPGITTLVVGIGEFLVHYWYWLVPPLLVLLAGDVLVFMLIRKQRNESFARVWAWAVIGLLGLVLVGMWLAVRLPLAGMTRGMPA